MRWHLSRIAASLALLTGFAPGPATADGTGTELPATKSVLFLNQEDRSFPAVAALLEGFRGAVAAAPFPVVVDVEDFDVSQLDRPGYLGELQRWLQAKYRENPPDVIVASGAEVLRHLLPARNEIFAGIPVVFVAVDRSVVDALSLPADVTGVAGGFDVRGTLEAALALLPSTRSVITVGRDTAYTHDTVAVVEAETARRSLEHVDLSHLATDEVLRRLGDLPDDAIVYFRSLPRDESGHLLEPARALQQVVAASNRPVFGDVATWVGLGIVGGSVIDPRTVGREGAAAALRILHGVPVSAIPVIQTTARYNAFDWRQLQRWGLDERRLPAGSAVLHREPSIWRQHWKLALGVAVVVVLQTALIAALVLERSHRKRAEGEARRQLHESAHWNRVASAGQLASSLAHELNQPLAAILSNAQAARRVLARESPDLDEARAALDDIVNDDRRAAAVIQRSRDLLAKRPPHLVPLDLNKVARDTAELLRGSARHRRTTIELDLDGNVPAVRGDAAQLQQVVLNLLSNAIDAVATHRDSERRVVLHTSRTDDRNVELAVRDSGNPLSQEALARLFEPFYTTKEHGLGVGLSICRSIVEAHGGRIHAEIAPGRGTLIRCSFPSVEDASP